MSRAIPICERCGFAHLVEEPCFGDADKDEFAETTMDERLRKLDEAGDKHYDSNKSDP